MSSLLVFNRVYRMEIQSFVLVFSTPLVNQRPSNLIGSPSSPLTVCNGGGGGGIGLCGEHMHGVFDQIPKWSTQWSSRQCSSTSLLARLNVDKKTCKATLRRVFYLSEVPSPPVTPYPPPPQKDYTDRKQSQMLLSKKITCKKTLRQVFYLSEAPSPPMTPYSPPPPLTHCMRVCIILIHTRRGGGGS